MMSAIERSKGEGAVRGVIAPGISSDMTIVGCGCELRVLEVIDGFVGARITRG